MSLGMPLHPLRRRKPRSASSSPARVRDLAPFTVDYPRSTNLDEPPTKRHRCGSGARPVRLSRGIMGVSRAAKRGSLVFEHRDDSLDSQTNHDAVKFLSEPLTQRQLELNVDGLPLASDLRRGTLLHGGLSLDSTPIFVGAGWSRHLQFQQRAGLRLGGVGRVK